MGKFKNFFKRWFKKKSDDDDFDDDFPTKEPWASTEEFLPKAKEKIKKASKTSAKKVKHAVKNFNVRKVGEHSNLIRWVIIIIALWLAADLFSRFVGLFIRPEYSALPRRPIPSAISKRPKTDFDSILRRNMFNVEGTIPEPFEQGLLDCLSQAKKSVRKLNLLGTIVMSDDRFSTALLNEEGNPIRVAVKPDDTFGNGKYLAMKIERKKFCFQVRATQEMEFIEVKEDQITMAKPAFSVGGSGSIQKLGESNFSVKRTFLESKLSDLNAVLASARAIPYMKNGKMEGFLIQQMDPDSLFRELGIDEGCVLLSVEDIKFDNMGKGLEAFQRLRNAPQVNLEVNCGGQKKTLNYSVK